MTASHHRSPLGEFLASETIGGLVLMIAAAVALVAANSPLAIAYHDAVAAHVAGIAILHAINDGLMALFFLVVGLEIKREAVRGELATWPRRILPGIAAFGGMIAPAIVYIGLNTGSAEALRGWAIPTATDIAFSLAVLASLGSRVPASLKIFLTALAIIDDLGAVIIIAFFYAGALSAPMLSFAMLTFLALIGLNRAGVTRLWPYLALGAVLWFFVYESGIHATMAGVLLAATIPLEPRTGRGPPLIRLEHGLQPWVTFGILPLFGFANAGVSLAGFGPAALLDSTTLGIALGLFIGKPVGVFSASALAIRLGFARQPKGTRLAHLFGVALICGIGFTMSLFIALLAFPGNEQLGTAAKLGVLLGSLASAFAGWLWLRAISRD